VRRSRLLHSLLAPRYSQLSVYVRLHHRTRVGAPKTTGQIQNPQDFFEAGIAGAPTENCSISAPEFGARVWRGILTREERRASGEWEKEASSPDRWAGAPAGAPHRLLRQFGFAWDTAANHRETLRVQAAPHVVIYVKDSLVGVEGGAASINAMSH
jgi:hypothetical protein